MAIAGASRADGKLRRVVGVDREGDLARYRELLGPAAYGMTDAELLQAVQGLAEAAAPAGITPQELAGRIGRGVVELRAWSRRREWRVIRGSGAELLDHSVSGRDVEVAAAAVYGPPLGLAWRAVVLTADDVRDGFTVLACGECVGSGVFLLPDDAVVRCNTCKGTAVVYATC